MAEHEMQDRRDRYQEELPADRDKVWTLLETYSHIPADEIEPHLRAVREKAWDIFPYTCIGGWRFLDLYVTTLPEYPAVVERLRAGDRLLDAGCCFGCVLRQLAADGAPPANLVGSDLRQEFLDLGYELFRDKETFAGKFVAGDMLSESLDNNSLSALDGTFDMIHAASFFHLFSWEDQVRLGERVVRFFRPGSEAAPSGQGRLLFGRQVGRLAPPDRATLAALGEYRFHHNPETLQQLWDEIGQRTATKWRVDARLVRQESPIVRRRAANGAVREEHRVLLYFAIYKLE